MDDEFEGERASQCERGGVVTGLLIGTGTEEAVDRVKCSGQLARGRALNIG